VFGYVKWKHPCFGAAVSSTFERQTFLCASSSANRLGPGVYAGTAWGRCEEAVKQEESAQVKPAIARTRPKFTTAVTLRLRASFWLDFVGIVTGPRPRNHLDRMHQLYA